MTDHNDDDDTPDDYEDENERPNFRRGLEDRLARAKKATEAEKARADAAERKLAFAEAGVSLSDPKTKYFVRGYDGDLTAEAIKQAAVEAGFIESDEAPVPVVGDEERAARERMSNPEAQPAGGRDFDAEMRAAKTPEEMDRIYMEAGGAMAPGYAPGSNV